jgi:arabinofuranosyltransferase
MICAVTLPRRLTGLLPVLPPFLAAVALTAAGWHLLWFLTDDAFISFRYASNWLQGYGPTWNPPPFLPVEGYTNFLWVALLTGVWAAFGVAPPVSANWVSLGLGFIALGLTTGLLWRALETIATRSRIVVLSVALLLLCTNRTFLTWLSSGLETSLWNTLVLWWVLEALAVSRRGAGALARMGLAASLLALTRPDGLGFWLASCTVAVLAWSVPGVMARSGQARPRALALGLTPLAIAPAHLIWRFSYYGEWLPNTYYAKVVAPWPMMGLRYLGSFVIEHGVAVWILAMLAALALAIRRGLLDGLVRRWREAAIPALVVGVLVAHVAYYVLIVGGDHFEYRVLSHLIPLLIVSLVWALARVDLDLQRQLAVLALFWIWGMTIPWTHWWVTHRLETRDETFFLRVELAESFPWPLDLWVGAWDDLQGTMIRHAVGTRHQEHKIFHRFQVATHPPRTRGSQLPWSKRHVLVAQAVGYPGWVFPHVAVIDMWGLNDRVIARAPASESDTRLMAHDRVAPAGYLECFEPDLIQLRPGEEETRIPLPADVTPGLRPRVQAFARSQPLRDARIRECEERSWH